MQNITTRIDWRWGGGSNSRPTWLVVRYFGGKNVGQDGEGTQQQKQHRALRLTSRAAVSQKMTNAAVLLIPDVATHLLFCPLLDLHPSKHIQRFMLGSIEGSICKMIIDRCPPSLPSMTCHVAQNRGEGERAQALYHSFLNLRFEVRELLTRGKTP